MIQDPTAPDGSTTAASNATQALDELWSDWVASPDDPAAKAALVDAVSDAVAAGVSEALDDAAADLADDATGGSAQDALAAADPDAAQDASAQIMHEEMTYGADDVLSDQLSALGAAENFNDGMMTSDGTRDYDWT